MSNYYDIKMIFRISDCLPFLGLMRRSYLDRTLVKHVHLLSADSSPKIRALSTYKFTKVLHQHNILTNRRIIVNFKSSRKSVLKKAFLQIQSVKKLTCITLDPIFVTKPFKFPNLRFGCIFIIFVEQFEHHSNLSKKTNSVSRSK